MRKKQMIVDMTGYGVIDEWLVDEERAEHLANILDACRHMHDRVLAKVSFINVANRSRRITCNLGYLRELWLSYSGFVFVGGDTALCGRPLEGSMGFQVESDSWFWKIYALDTLTARLKAEYRRKVN